MTTKDKTGDQLMASIRKTKTEGTAPEEAPGGQAPAGAEAEKTATAKAKPAASRTAPKRPRTTRKKVVAKAKPAESAARQEGDAYQSSGRVWPD